MISAEVLTDFRRRRIKTALGELCVEKTHQGFTMAEIAARAGVSKKTLYEQFRNRDQVLEEAVEDAFSDLLGRVAGACARAGADRGEPLSAGLAEALGWVASEPGPAWLCLIEALRGTADTRARYLDALSHFGEMIRDAFPEEAARPAVIGQSLAGGVASILASKVGRGEGDRVPEMQEEFMIILRVPFAGK